MSLTSTRSPRVSPLTVRLSKFSMPLSLREISFITAFIPPALPMSSMCTFGKLGLILAMWAMFWLILFSSLISKFTPASLEMASMWRTVLLLPPIAISTTSALRIAFSFSMFLILNFSSRAISQILRAACLMSSSRSGVSARIVPLPGSAMPIASQSVFIEFAVNIPLQLPPLGHALHSISFSSASSISFVSNLPTASNAVARSIGLPSFV